MEAGDVQWEEPVCWDSAVVLGSFEGETSIGHGSNAVWLLVVGNMVQGSSAYGGLFFY